MSFKFKQFSICDDQCGMKVGVDGVLLGAWTDFSNSQYILDIGTGSGLLMLIAAQQNKNAIISGIDLNLNAINQAQENINKSDFKNEFQLINQDFIKWDSPTLFDTLICNPPFFPGINEEINIDRQQARFSIFLPLDNLMLKANKISTTNATFNLIYPTQFLNELTEAGINNNWSVKRITTIKGNPQVISKRSMISFKKLVPNLINEIINDEITIEESRHQFTDEYKELTKPYYLKF